ncbi:MAG: pirin family protein [Acidimicrobiia bacterium]
MRQLLEIVTSVLDGELEHRDSEGNEGVIHPGLAQRISAGCGIMNSEMNRSASTDVVRR